MNENEKVQQETEEKLFILHGLKLLRIKTKVCFNETNDTILKEAYRADLPKIETIIQKHSNILIHGK